jgi:hypothetical protein
MEKQLSHEDTKSRSGFFRKYALRVFVASWLMLFPGFAILAAPTQEEVFKSISDNVGSSTDPKRFAAFVLAVVALVILLAVVSKRKQRQVTPKILNHQGKLLKEIAKHIDLRPAEIRQLKALAEEQNLSSPLTLLLCPSILAKAVKERSGKVDKRAILSVAKKLG